MTDRSEFRRRAERLRERRENLIASGVDPADLATVHDLTSPTVADSLPKFQAVRGPVVYNTALVVQLQYLRALVRAWITTTLACTGAFFACVTGLRPYITPDGGIPFAVYTLGAAALGWAYLTVTALLRVRSLRRQARACDTKTTEPEESPSDQ